MTALGDAEDLMRASGSFDLCCAREEKADRLPVSRSTKTRERRSMVRSIYARRR